MAEIAPSNIQSALHCRKTIAFDGSAGNGAIGAVNLFTITGQVTLLAVYVYCSGSLVSAGGGTLVLGDAAVTNSLILITTATAITVGNWWIDATPTAQDRTLPAGLQNYLAAAAGSPVKMTVATGAITGGTLVFDVFWLPLSPDGSVVPV